MDAALLSVLKQLVTELREIRKELHDLKLVIHENAKKEEEYKRVE